VSAAPVRAGDDTPLRQRVLRRLRRQPTVKGALVVLVAIVAFALVGPYLVPQNPYDTPMPAGGGKRGAGPQPLDSA